MAKPPADPLDALVSDILKSAKYSRVCEELVRHIGADELSKRRSLKDASKATKNKLHQVGGAFLDSSLAGLSGSLKTAAQSGDLRAACESIMAHHASTRERLPILDEFYPALFADLPPVRSILDVACGLNPLAIPWMPLAPGAPYFAYDIYTDMIAFLNGVFAYLGVPGRAAARDVTQFVPPEPVHLALVLKTLPCLEQIDKFAGLRLLEGLKAEFVLVTFPVRSLGGYDKNMRANYEAHLQDLLKGRPWTAQRFEFATELAFLIDRRETL
jgi:16S rRNA (guanine(1405)-N(7))-methyltransferase